MVFCFVDRRKLISVASGGNLEHRPLFFCAAARDGAAAGIRSGCRRLPPANISGFWQIAKVFGRDK